MEFNTEESCLKFYNFDDKELLKKCVIYVNDLLEEYPIIKIFGKKCHQRRCVGFFSDESIGYSYSKQLSLSKPMNESLNLLIKKVNDKFKANYNGILVNKYKTGEYYISAHSYDERNLEECGILAIS